MSYTVKYCDAFMDELLDKMGSDYFPLPIKLSRFESVTLDFIRETTNFLETTQELSDDIVNLTTSEIIPLGPSKNATYMGKPVYKVKYPEDYIRFMNMQFIDEVNGKYSYGRNDVVKLYRIGEFNMNNNNPFRQAKGKYVNIYRIDNSIIIDTDQKLTHSHFTYVRKPVFGKLADDRMVDLNDQIVNKLMQKTCVALRATSSDQDTQFIDEYVERQGQKIK